MILETVEDSPHGALPEALEDKDLYSAFIGEINRTVIKRARICLGLALILNAAYLVLEQSFFRSHLVPYIAAKIVIMALLMISLPVTRQAFFEKKPVFWAALLFCLHLILESWVFIISGGNASYISSYILSMLFLALIFPFHYRVTLGLIAATLMAFNSALLMLLGNETLARLFKPAQELDAVFFLNQNLLLILLGILIFFKSLFDSRLKLREFIFHKRLFQTKDNLEKSLTHLKETQTQLVLTEKMASLGRLVAGITHELNNPINFIYGHLKPLEKNLLRLNASLQGVACPERDALVKDSQEIIQTLRDGSLRMRNIIRDLLTFSHGTGAGSVTVESSQYFDLHDCIDKSLAVIQHLCRNYVKIQKDYGPIPPVYGQSGPMHQVLLNVLTNAFQAIRREEGEIFIKTRSYLNEKRQPCVVLSILDNGEGISHEHLDRIFEPFYTTKKEGEGTGLGLSISLSIMKMMHGDISVRSQPGVGSEFFVHMPTAPLNAKPQKKSKRLEVLAEEHAS